MRKMLQRSSCNKATATKRPRKARSEKLTAHPLALPDCYVSCGQPCRSTTTGERAPETSEENAGEQQTGSMAGFGLKKCFTSELLFPAWSAPREAAGLEFLQLQIVFYKPVYDCSFLFSREPQLLNSTALFTICIPGCKLPLVRLKQEPQAKPPDNRL